MEKIISIVILILYGVVMLLMCYIAIFQKEKKSKKPKNNVHFYVARDKNGELSLYLTKPVRHSSRFCSSIYGQVIALEQYFENFNLKVEDFKDLKWEDEPVEVFVSIKS